MKLILYRKCLYFYINLVKFKFFDSSKNKNCILLWMEVAIVSSMDLNKAWIFYRILLINSPYRPNVLT